MADREHPHDHRADRADRADRRTTAAPVPDRVRMPLLALITQQSLDEDYQHAADRRASGAAPVPRARSVKVAAVVVMVFGVLASTAFVQTNRNADVASASRATLIARIESASDRRAVLERRVASLRARVGQLERGTSRLTDDQQGLALTQRRLQVATGFVAVRGEGVRVTVTPAPGADEVQEIQDADLRLLVNGLFEAGAEAVAINGQRMAATTAIRTSGVAIGVNLVGVAPPFDVEAIGDTRTLAARFADTTTGQLFAANAAFYGFTYSVDNVDELRLPAAPASRQVLRSARELLPQDDQNQRGGTTP